MVATIVSSCEQLFCPQDKAPELSMTINAPSLNLKNRYFTDICTTSLFNHTIHSIELYVDPNLSFELQIANHTLESRRDKDPIAELWVFVYMEEALELNKKYYFRSVGDYETATDYSFAGAKLKLDGQIITVNDDGWVRFTQIDTRNGEAFSEDNTDITKVRGEFAFTGYLDGYKVEVSDGQFITERIY